MNNENKDSEREVDGRERGETCDANNRISSLFPLSRYNVQVDFSDLLRIHFATEFCLLANQFLVRCIVSQTHVVCTTILLLLLRLLLFRISCGSDSNNRD